MGEVIYLAPQGEGIFQAHKGRPRPLPFFVSTVPAGFPSPAEDYAEECLDINDYLVARPAATYYVRVKGDSMTGVGIFDGDLLVVDRSVKANNGMIVLAVVDGDVTVKRLMYHRGHYILQAENPKYAPILIPEGSELMVWGVVMYVIHQPR